MRKRWLAISAGLVLVCVLWVSREWTKPYRGYAGNQILIVQPGTRATTVAKLLAERGVLAHRWPFLLRYWIGRPRHRLKAGAYFFDRSLTPLDVYRKLAEGDFYIRAVVIPEGSERFDIARILQQQLGVKPEEFLKATEQTAAIRDLDPEARTLEGYLFPDTYRFMYGVSPATVVATMLARFRRLLGSELGGEIRKSSRKLHDIVTLASIVEKETSDDSERPIIAGVFMTRLERHWPLQSEVTVIYAIRLSHSPIGHPFAPIRQINVNIDSPYNTYRVQGLPRGPISNPGETSIRAAVQPAPGKFFYFVSNNHGGNVFARTLAEHHRNVARYRRQLAALGRGPWEGKSHRQ